MPETLSNSGFPSSSRDFPGSLSIDKIALIYNVPRLLSDRENNMQFHNLLNSILHGADKELNPNFLYEFNVNYRGIIVSWGRGVSDVGDAVRLEFNPNKLEWEKTTRLLKLLGGLGSILWGRISRIDVAIDYLTEINPFMFHDTYKRKSGYWNGSRGVETVYFGSGKSDVMFRIYDKATEQRESFDISTDSSWWRVEAEIKKSNEIVNGIENPFKNLHYSVLEGWTLPPCQDYLSQFFWCYAEHHGLDTALKLLPKSTRYKFKKRLINSNALEMPSEVFDRCFSHEWQKFLGMMSAFAT